MNYIEFMKNPPKYIFDGFNVWEHRVCTPFHKVPGYIKMDRMKSGKFRVNRRKSLIYIETAYYYVHKRRIFSVVNDPNKDIFWEIEWCKESPGFKPDA